MATVEVQILCEELQNLAGRLDGGRKHVDVLGRYVAAFTGSVKLSVDPAGLEHLFAGCAIFQDDQITLLQIQSGLCLRLVVGQGDAVFASLLQSVQEEVDQIANVETVRRLEDELCAAYGVDRKVLNERSRTLH